MSKVYVSSLETAFAGALAALYEEQGYEVVTEPMEEIEYFIDTTDVYVSGDDKRVGEGIDIEAAVEAYHKNVSEPVANLEKVLNTMTGKKRICFLNTVKSSINYSEEITGFGHHMARAALNLILVLSKNGLVENGYTFRLFDPLTNQVDPRKAAKSAFGYFTRDRFFDDPADGLGRDDEQNLVIRDALGRELPW